MSSSPLLTARGLTMQYPGVRALNGVDFTLRAGEIHALCGENGAGKSTLIKILGGVTPTGAHGGSVELNGALCHFAGPGDALRAGIRVIHQELALCPDMTVAENVFLGDELMRGGLSWGVPDSQRMEHETRVALDSLGLHDLAPDARVGGLPVGLRQMVEIARALKTKSDTRSPAAKVLILDEPTSALSAREAERLMLTLQRLRDNGLGILYISHRLDEVFRLADRITVLRGGETTGTMERTAFGEPYDAAHVVALMTGGTTAAGPRFTAAGAAAPEKQSPPILSVRDWTVTDPANPARRLVDAVSFDLHAGEILGFAGLMGAGRTELMESLCGLQPGGATLQGSLLLDGKPYAPRDAAHAQRLGIALVCEDRRARGLFADKSVRVNMTVSALRNFCTLGWLTRERRERVEAQARVQSLHVKTPGTEFIAGNLSGGNQQKALLARALLTKPRILILDEPTRGIDVGAKEELYALIAELASSGMAVLLVSSETSEVLRLAHRVIVMRAGRAAAQRPASTLTLEETLALAAGGTVA
jgi:ABC-type sugar transport system ATPase subunit